MREERQHRETQSRVIQSVKQAPKGMAIVDNRDTAQHKLFDVIQRANEGKTPFVDNRDTPQIRLMKAIQRMGMEDEEELQMKPITQLQSEDEELQMKPVAQLQSEDEELQMKPIVQLQSEDDELLQGKFETIQQKPNNTGLPDNLKSGVENMSGFSMDDVRVHYNSDKPAQIQAHAYAQGSDIHVAPGQEKHLPHETWHVVQQMQGRVRPTMQLQGVGVNDDENLEREADKCLEKINNHETAQYNDHIGSPVDNSLSSFVVQRVSKSAIVTGITHLVEAKGNSIFKGEECLQVDDGTEIEIDTNQIIRSRRGPNQRYNRANDMIGQPIYTWMRVLRVGSTNYQRHMVFIRADTFLCEGHEAPPEDLRKRTAIVPSQNVALVGTQHTRGYNVSSAVKASFLDGSDLILEHPTHYRRNGIHPDPFSLDETQGALLARAKTGNTRVIGADGRKVFADKRIHYLTIRSSYTSKHEIHCDNPKAITDLASAFIECCLGLNKFDITMIVSEITRLLTYNGKNAPDVPLVLFNDYNRVNTITKYFKINVKEAIKNKILTVLASDLEKIGTELAAQNEDIYAHQMVVRSQLEVINSSPQETIDATTYKDIEDLMLQTDDAPPSASIENLELFERQAQGNPSDLETLDALEAIAIIAATATLKSFDDDGTLKIFHDLKKLNDLNDEITRLAGWLDSNNKKKSQETISVFHDSICNLTLFAETLASNRENLVIAFGASHIEPLGELLEEVNKVHKNFNLTITLP